jgi:hypothetical protein
MLIFLCAGWAAVSCMCLAPAAFHDGSRRTNTYDAPSNPSTERTRAVLEELEGEPYLVAEFPSGGKIHLRAPQPDAVVADPWVDVVGTAPAETVITLDGEIVVAGPDGMFYARVPLEEGVNEIQCVASDLLGNEVTFSILVAYEPDGGAPSG